MNHVEKGLYGEKMVKSALIKLGYEVLNHKVTSGGVDTTAYLDNYKVICEVLNWYGGYIHPERFMRIVLNLLETPSNEKYLICIGVEPTQKQKKLLIGYGIKLICTKNSNLDPIKDLSRQFKTKLGVITLIYYQYSFFPETVCKLVWTVLSARKLKDCQENWLGYLILYHYKNDSLDHLRVKR